MSMRIPDSNKTFKTAHSRWCRGRATEEFSELEELAKDPEADNGDSFEF